MIQVLNKLKIFLKSENTTTVTYSLPSLNNIDIDDLKFLLNYAQTNASILTLTFKNIREQIPVSSPNILTMIDDLVTFDTELKETEFDIVFNKENFFKLTTILPTNLNFFTFFNLSFAFKKIHELDTIFLNNKLILVVLDDEDSTDFSNDYFIIKSIKNKSLDSIIKEDVIPIPENKKNNFNSKLDFFNKTKCSSINKTPYFWHMPEQNSLDSNKNPALKDFYYYAIITFFNIISDKKIDNSTFLIRGHYNLEFSIKEDVPPISYNDLFNLLDFISDDKSDDKLLILRNVLTNYLTKNSNVENFSSQLDVINSSVKHHYSLFIQEELKVFLEQKQQVITESVNMARNISTHTNSINSTMKNTIFASILTLISSSIPDLIEKVDSNNVLILLSFLMFVYLIFCINNLYNESELVDSMIQSFKNSLKYIASESIDGLKFEELKKNFFQNELLIFNKTATITLILYILLIFLDGAIFITLIK